MRRLAQSSLFPAPIMLGLAVLAACGGPDPNTSGRAPLAEKWLTRAKATINWPLRPPSPTH